MTADYVNAIGKGVTSCNSADLNTAALKRLVEDARVACAGTITLALGTYAVNGTVSPNTPAESSIHVPG